MPDLAVAYETCRVWGLCVSTQEMRRSWDVRSREKARDAASVASMRTTPAAERSLGNFSGPLDDRIGINDYAPESRLRA